jgi:type I restriction enzyme M protein
VFTATGAGVKTNLLFFTRGKPTEKVWYYDLSDRKVTRKKPLLLTDFDDFFRLLPERAESERSWTVSRAELDRRGLDLKAVNPNRNVQVDERTPIQILDEIDRAGIELRGALTELRQLLS